MIKNWEQYLPSFIRRHFEGRKNLKKITENIGWLFFDKILRMGMGLVVGVWVARYLGPEQFGTWNYAMAFSALFGTFATLGLDGIAVRELVKTPEKENEILSSAFILCLAGGVFAFLASGAAISILKPQDTLTFWLVVIASAGFIFQSLMVIDYLNQAKIKSKNTVIAMNTAFLIFSVVKVGLILLNAPLITFALAGLAEIVLGMALMLIFFLKNKTRFSFNPYFIRIKTLLKDSWPLILSGFAIMVYMKIDQIMIGEMLGEKAVGQYAAAARISEAWYFIPMVISGSLFPAIIKAKEQSEKLYYERLQKLYDLRVGTFMHETGDRPG
jgi:PST family polysaccharide transporter